MREGVIPSLVWIEFFELLFASDNVGAPFDGYVQRPPRKIRIRINK